MTDAFWAGLATSYVELPLTNIALPAKRVRQEGDATEGFEALCRSVARHGILQPIVVRKVSSQVPMFEIVAGCRRYLAAKRAQFGAIPAIVWSSVSAKVALELALIENCQREDLGPLDLARGIRAFMEVCGCNQKDAARQLGLSEYQVGKALSLLKLPEAVQIQVDVGELSPTHAEELVPFARQPERLGELVERAKVTNYNQFRTEVRAEKRDGSRTRTHSDIPDGRLVHEPKVKLEILTSKGERRVQAVRFPDDAALEAGLERLREFAL